MTARVLAIAGTGSGVGKTSVAVGLARALRRRGVRVLAAKVGPDFLDPMQLSVATGRPCINLDSHMMGEAYVRALVAQGARDVDIILIEGVMGLFDGVEPLTSHGSTAEVAQILGAPIVLVADAQGQGRSFAATVAGFAHFEPGVNVAGVIANRVGSAGHGMLLGSALVSANLPSLIAAIPGDAMPHLASRHLGLIAPEDACTIDALADAVEQTIPLESLMSLARSPSGIEGAPAPAALPHACKPVRLAVAEDRAFGFVYADFREQLRQRGVDWLSFSPLKDTAVPEGADALFLPGGYPEVHAEQLAANRSVLESIRRFAERRPVYAECGGLMVVGESLLDGQGVRHRMAGVLPFSTCIGQRLARLGYCTVTLTQDSLWGRRGETCRGHEFHYSSIEQDPGADLERCYSVAYRKGSVRDEGYQRRRVLASYVHLHLPSRVGKMDHFLEELAR